MMHLSPRSPFLRRNLSLLCAVSLMTSLSGCKEMAQMTSKGASLVGAGAAIGCQYAADIDPRYRGVACAAAGTLVGLATAYASNEVIAYLEEADQRAAIDAATESLKTGKEVTIELPVSKKILVAKAEPAPDVQQDDEEILVETKQVASLEQRYDAIGTIHRTTRSAKAHAGPGDSFDVRETIPSGSKLHVFGKAVGEPWYLVGKGVEVTAGWSDDLTLSSVATGYIHESALQSTDLETDQLAQIITVPGKQQSDSMETQEATWNMQCASEQYTLNDADSNKTTQDTSTICHGPLGRKSL